MENVEHLPTLNPRQEGDFLVYADAEQLPDGGWATYYRIDRHPAGQSRIETVVARRRFGAESFKTADIARMMAVEYAVSALRQGSYR